MKKIKLNHLIEYISPILILSYFYIHNIFLVLIGIIFSFYFINIDFILSFIRSMNKNLDIENVSKEFHKNIKDKKSNSFNIKSSKEDSQLTLVEMIEELGFIPSIDKNDDGSVA